jgi:hypothetical protein
VSRGAKKSTEPEAMAQGIIPKGMKAQLEHLLSDQPMDFSLFDLPPDVMERASDGEPMPLLNFRASRGAFNQGHEGTPLAPRLSYINNEHRGSISGLSLDSETLELLDYEAERADEMNVDPRPPQELPSSRCADV